MTALNEKELLVKELAATTGVPEKTIRKLSLQELEELHDQPFKLVYAYMRLQMEAIG